MSELLSGRWAETKEALLEGLQGTKKSVMGVTLENTRKYLMESPTTGATYKEQSPDKLIEEGV